MLSGFQGIERVSGFAFRGVRVLDAVSAFRVFVGWLGSPQALSWLLGLNSNLMVMGLFSHHPGSHYSHSPA